FFFPPSIMYCCAISAHTSSQSAKQRHRDHPGGKRSKSRARSDTTNSGCQRGTSRCPTHQPLEDIGKHRGSRLCQLGLPIPTRGENVRHLLYSIPVRCQIFQPLHLRVIKTLLFPTPLHIAGVGESSWSGHHKSICNVEQLSRVLHDLPLVCIVLAVNSSSNIPRRAAPVID